MINAIVLVLSVGITMGVLLIAIQFSALMSCGKPHWFFTPFLIRRKIKPIIQKAIKQDGYILEEISWFTGQKLVDGSFEFYTCIRHKDRPFNSSQWHLRENGQTYYHPKKGIYIDLVRYSKAIK